MKKILILIFCFGLFLISWKTYQNKRQESVVPSSPQQTLEESPSPLSTSSKGKKKSPKRKLKKVLTRKKRTAENNFQKSFDEKRMAIGDEKGNLYPTSLGIDGDHIIAFGDLIVGHVKDIEAIRNGEKVVSIPHPKLWPKGIIPISVSLEVRNSQQYKWIQEIAKDLKQRVQIDIRPADKQHGSKPQVNIIRGNEHCYAQVGYTGKPTQMSLGKNCSKMAIYHEFFHVLGFFHEQNRFDRQEYLNILWENIDEQYWPQFKLFPENSFQRKFTSGGPFQFTFNTIMIYDSSFFSINEDYSMVRADGSAFSSKFYAPTEIDIIRLKELYENELSSNN